MTVDVLLRPSTSYGKRNKKRPFLWPLSTSSTFAARLGHLVSGSNLEVVEGFLRSIRSPTSVLPFISWINCNNDDVGHMLRFPKQLK